MPFRFGEETDTQLACASMRVKIRRKFSKKSWGRRQSRFRRSIAKLHLLKGVPARTTPHHPHHHDFRSTWYAGTRSSVMNEDGHQPLESRPIPLFPGETREWALAPDLQYRRDASIVVSRPTTIDWRPSQTSQRLVTLAPCEFESSRRLF